MSIEVLQRHLGPGMYTRLLKWMAPHGWNANTQFFLVFLGVLGLHLWLAPVVMRSATVAEPGDGQGHLTSEGSTESAESQKPKPAGFEKNELAPTDPALVAKPLSEAEEDDVEIGKTDPTPVEVASSEKKKDRIPPPVLPPAKEATNEKSDSLPPTPEAEKELLVAVPAELPVVESAEPGPKPKEEKSESPEPKDSEPSLTDLIADAPAAPSAKPAEENQLSAGKGSKPPPSGQTRLRAFRQLQ
jgi:hypothetical protein